jgi:pyruvate/2-oxoacid:ferredoxin oxidoreductase beta subunit
MDKFGLYVPQLLPFKEHFLPQAHPACMGCGVALGMRHAYKALEETRNWMKGASWKIPYRLPLPGSLTKSKKEAMKEIQPALLYIEKCNQSNLFLCFDNEAVEGKPTSTVFKKWHPAVAVARGFHYVATACPSYPFDLIDKVKRGMESEGSSYIHILSPCPVGWDFESELTVKIGRYAVECAIFPLYEVVTGSYRLTIDHPKIRPVDQYLRLQNRFKHLKQKEILEIQAEVDREYAKLREGKI